MLTIIERRLLRVEAPHFTAAAEFEKHKGQWRCVNAAPIIKWMVGKPPGEIRGYLKYKGWRYTWH